MPIPSPRDVVDGKASASKGSGAGTASSPGFRSPEGFTVRLIPVVGPTAFAASKLTPDRNSVRWVAASPAAAASDPVQEGGSSAGAAEARLAATATKAAPSAGSGEAAGLLPTPRYNTGVLQDLLSSSHAAYLSSAFSSSSCSDSLAAARGGVGGGRLHPRLADAVLLLKTWARERGLTGRPDVFDGHALTMLIVHLAKQGKLVRMCDCVFGKWVATCVIARGN
jgi:hypothetical protein